MPIALPTESQSKTLSSKGWTFFKILQMIAFIAAWFGAMFLAAGTVRWLRGWIYTVAMLGMYAVMGVYIHR